MGDEKVSCIFKGIVRRKTYTFYDNKRIYGDGYTDIPKIHSGVEYVKGKTFYTKEILLPTYRRFEQVYINDLDLTVNIYDVLRSVDEETIYKTDYVIEVIEDEESLDYKAKAEIKLKKEMVEYNAWKSIGKDDTKTKKWFEFWK